jgi:hypothetical protein
MPVRSALHDLAVIDEVDFTALGTDDGADEYQRLRRLVLIIVCFARKATEALRCREASLCAGP